MNDADDADAGDDGGGDDGDTEEEGCVHHYFENF